MRVSGLASGMQIDDIVKQYMSSQRAPLDKLSQNKQILEWRRDNYKQVNSSLVDFRQNKLGEYRKPSSMSMYSSEVTGDKEAVSVKATNTSNMTSMDVKVESIATAATIKSGTLAVGTNLSTRLDSIQGGTTAPFYVNEFKFEGTDTIKNVLDKINGDKDANLSATFDEASRQIIIKSKSFNDVSIKGNLTATMEKYDTSLDADADGKFDGKAKQAKVTINGESVAFNGNTATINGVEITLLKASKTNEVSTISTKADGKKAVETIKAFIEDYNNLIKSLNSKISEKKYKDFAPLTSEQKKEMEEDDIKLWTEKAQSGLLRGDSIISEGLTTMRSTLINASVKLGDKTISLPDIGITTGTYTENGKLYLDEEKLQKAIAENPDQIMELFVGSSDGSTKGIFDKLYDSTLNTLGKISDKSGTSKYSSDITQTLNEQSTMGKELTDLNSRIAEMTKKMTTLETNYYNKFNAMEQAINKLNSQSSSITNMLSQ